MEVVVLEVVVVVDISSVVVELLVVEVVTSEVVVVTLPPRLIWLIPDSKPLAEKRFSQASLFGDRYWTLNWFAPR